MLIYTLVHKVKPLLNTSKMKHVKVLVVVVSEETGQISVAVKGGLTRNYTRETLKGELESLLIPEKPSEKRPSRLSSRRRNKKK